MKKLPLNEEFILEGYVYVFTAKDSAISLKRVREAVGGKATTKPLLFTPPSLQEFKKYFLDNGYKEDVGERAWRSYDVADWHKSNGEKVRNWKQTCIQVWFKLDNAIIKPEATNGIKFFQ